MLLCDSYTLLIQSSYISTHLCTAYQSSLATPAIQHSPTFVTAMRLQQAHSTVISFSPSTLGGEIGQRTQSGPYILSALRAPFNAPEADHLK